MTCITWATEKPKWNVEPQPRNDNTKDHKTETILEMYVRRKNSLEQIIGNKCSRVKTRSMLKDNSSLIIEYDPMH